MAILIHHSWEKVSSSNYEFKRHTLYPCLRAFVVFMLVGFAILTKQNGQIKPEFSVFYFAFAIYFLVHVYQTHKQEKLTASENSKTAQS